MPSQDADADAALQSGSRWTIAIIAMLGLGLGLAVFAFRGPTFEAEARVAVANPAGALAAEIRTVTGEQVLGAATAALGFEPDISTSAASTSGQLIITASADDPDDAAAAANMVAATYVQARAGTAATITQVAESPNDPTGLGPLIFAGVGALLGGLVGLIVASIRIRRRRQDFLQSQHSPPRSTAGPGIGIPQSPPVPPLPDMPAAPDMAAVPDMPDKPAGLDLPAVPDTPDKPAGLDLPTVPDTPDKPAGLDLPTVPDTPDKPAGLDLPTGLDMPATTTGTIGPLIHSTPSGLAVPDALSSVPATGFEGPLVHDVALQASSFSDAASDEDESSGLTWLSPAPSSDAPPSLEQLDRRSLQAQFDAARYELVLTHDQQAAKLAADHERETASLRGEITSLNKQVRMQSVRLKNRTGNDQSRVGDLEIQVDALEVELASLRQTLESERISHTKRITDERGAADRALDNARRQYREELSKHVHSHRQTLALHRGDLDSELAADRAKQAQALEQQHRDYETELDNERSRAESKLAAAQDRHEREIAALKAANLQELDRQATQHKQTISSLRNAGEGAQGQLRELEKENRKLRVELTSQQKQATNTDTENTASQQRLRDEVALLKSELDGERQRNAALRADVLRRSAEAHQAIDRAVEERTAQLTELEASVSRQRQYADSRVREVSAAAEEQSRQAATREASLVATVSRLKRELEELKQVLGQNEA